MSKRYDMIGKKFHDLSVLREAVNYSESSKDKFFWCLCDCGKECVTRGIYLRSGHTKTCGDCRTYTVETGFMRCTLKDGRSFIFDIEDLPIVKQHRWTLDNEGYVTTSQKEKNTKLHRVLTAAPSGKSVNHRNGDHADNRKSNLRIAEHRFCTCSTGLKKNSSTGYKGVCYIKKYGKYLASIHPNRKTKFLGYFDTAEKAAAAYDEAAREYYGEFAVTNMDLQKQSSI